jgi:hypothetical protein
VIAVLNTVERQNRSELSVLLCDTLRTQPIGLLSALRIDYFPGIID